MFSNSDHSTSRRIEGAAGNVVDEVDGEHQTFLGPLYGRQCLEPRLTVRPIACAAWWLGRNNRLSGMKGAFTIDAPLTTAAPLPRDDYAKISSSMRQYSTAKVDGSGVMSRCWRFVLFQSLILLGITWATYNFTRMMGAIACLRHQV